MQLILQLLTAEIESIARPRASLAACIKVNIVKSFLIVNLRKINFAVRSFDVQWRGWPQLLQEKPWYSLKADSRESWLFLPKERRHGR